MSKTIAAFTDGDTSILVETAEETQASSVTRGSRGAAGITDTLKNLIKPVADSTFKDTMSIISYASNTILEEIQSIDKAPETAEVTFGIKLNGAGKAMIASGSVEANYTVKLSWKKPEKIE